MRWSYVGPLRHATIELIRTVVAIFDPIAFALLGDGLRAIRAQECRAHGFVGSVVAVGFAIAHVAARDAHAALTHEAGGHASALVVSLVLLMLISVTIGLRVSEEAEAAGLVVSTHGESVE